MFKQLYVKPMCPMSYVVQKAGGGNSHRFLNHIGHRAHRFHIEEINMGYTTASLLYLMGQQLSLKIDLPDHLE